MQAFRQPAAVFLSAIVSLSVISPHPVYAGPDGGDDLCFLPADPGPCEGICPRFFHNAETGQCEEFTWGCCDGNANNFETVEACEAACVPTLDDCFLPADGGPCDGICPRFFYSVETHRCELFYWGCCGGNFNNFLTLQACESNCEALATAAIPAMSLWGVVVATLLLIAAGTVILTRGRAESKSIVG